MQISLIFLTGFTVELGHLGETAQAKLPGDDKNSNRMSFVAAWSSMGCSVGFCLPYKSPCEATASDEQAPYKLISTCAIIQGGATLPYILHKP